METLMSHARKMQTETILEAAKMIGGGEVDADKRMVRAALIQVYGERMGGEAADRLMDSLGM